MTPPKRHDKGTTWARGRGYSLLEVGLVLAIVALLIAAVMEFLLNVQDQDKATDAQVEMLTLIQAANSVKTQNNLYNGVSATTLINTKTIPDRFVLNSSTLTNPYHGTVTIAPKPYLLTGTNDSLAIWFYGISNRACEQLSVANMGNLVELISVNSKFTVTGGVSLTGAQAVANCNAGNSNVVLFEFQ